MCTGLGAVGLGVHRGDPLDGVSGSLAFGTLPPAVLVAAENPNTGQEAKWVLMRAKVSNGPDWGGFD